MTSKLGDIIRLQPLPSSALPAHDSLPSSDTAPDLSTFILEALDEARAFVAPLIHSSAFTSPSSLAVTNTQQWKLISEDTSDCGVTLLKRRITTAETKSAVLPPSDPAPRRKSSIYNPANPPAEMWFCRRSRHGNRGGDAIATWSRLSAAIAEDHMGKEFAYTPSLRYSAKLLEYQIDTQKTIGEYSNVQMAVYTNEHATPWPSSNRTFNILVLSAFYGPTASATTTATTTTTTTPPPSNPTPLPQPNACIVIQLPITLPPTPLSNPPVKVLGGPASSTSVQASYVSVEHGLFIPEKDESEWVMATASDAGGMIPKMVQEMAVPGQIKKDVRLAVEWIESEMRGRTRSV